MSWSQQGLDFADELWVREERGTAYDVRERVS